MPRISGVIIPEEKKIKVALNYIYGIGRNNVFAILDQAQLDPEKRAKDLSDLELNKLQKAVESVPIEGSLRKMVSENIKRLRQINSFRGSRHANRLPSRGQRTRVNARTKRGKRMTVGALKKELAQKMEDAKKAKTKE
ncbi:30S ribosomal protein S13 [Candidatus Beckwithbacteria bacterium CG10_big_fil_rev_8_21_14_0_10_34_10]|uniref:Small ribosomal subunit protein uS13 n=1 Tax=Candidatus Beckwithbacteria bacterium CG10_big_fil_rev_8_21_14_0_10_34_10 TaxID=1974495 RepID=A0A2H0W7U4_9BACT|nr:MAG: 30S ribosomal protein S13 [Candidatus Beckwithbacteria bacterium CG10_big_fil_rev_8_21_14_0_10_34_10]